MKLLNVQLPPLPSQFLPHRPEYLHQHLFSKTHSVRSSLSAREQVSHPDETIGKVIVLYIFYIFIFR